MREVDLQKKNQTGIVVDAGKADVQKTPRKFFIDHLFSLCGSLGSVLFVGVGFIVVFEIVMRFVFRSPTTWTGESAGP